MLNKIYQTKKEQAIYNIQCIRYNSIQRNFQAKIWLYQRSINRIEAIAKRECEHALLNFQCQNERIRLIRSAGARKSSIARCATMPISKYEDILILAKTYPSPSSRYVETSCIAGINSEGHMRRLYPVPFRRIEEKRQFDKWQWINVRVEKTPPTTIVRKATGLRLIRCAVTTLSRRTTTGQSEDRGSTRSLTTRISQP